jgi:hypothetical protein
MTAVDCPVCGDREILDDRCPRCTSELAELRILRALQAEPVPGRPQAGVPGLWQVISVGLAVLVGVGLGRLSLPLREPIRDANSLLPASGSVPSAAPAASGGPAPPGASRTGSAPLVVVARSGDSLWRIARRVYGQGRHHPRLVPPGHHRVLQPGDRVLAPVLD